MNRLTTDILTPEQAADYLQVNRETIYRYIRAGKLSASRLGRGYRITKYSLGQLLRDNHTRPEISLREYSNQQITDFLEADKLDAEAQFVIREFEARANASCA